MLHKIWRFMPCAHVVDNPRVALTLSASLSPEP